MIVILTDTTVQEGKTVYKDVQTIWIHGTSIMFMRSTTEGPEYIYTSLPHKCICEPGEDPARMLIPAGRVGMYDNLQ